MADPKLLEVEVIYALPDEQHQVTLQVAPGTTVREVLMQATTQSEFPELDVTSCPVGVFGREVESGFVVAAGDRVEVYRPLAMDPREARRRAAEQGKTLGGRKQNSGGSA